MMATRSPRRTPSAASQCAKRDDHAASSAKLIVSSRPVGVGDAQRDPARHGVTIDALVPDIQMLAVAVEQFPKPRGGEQALGVGIRRVMRQITHAEPSRLRPLVVQTGS